MILLFNTTDEIELITGQAVTVDVHASFVDMTQADPPVVKGTTSGQKNTAITTATTTDIVDGPASSVTRNVKTLNIRNKHATDSVTVTVQFDQNGTKFELHKVTLAAGEALEYVEGVGFFVLGAIVPAFFKVLTADQSNSTTTPTEVTGLTLPTRTGHFAFEYYVICQSAATTTGHKLSVNYDGTVTSFTSILSWLTAATTASDDVVDQDHVAAPGGVVSGFSARAKSTAGWGATTDVDTLNADVLYRITGSMTVTGAEYSSEQIDRSRLASFALIAEDGSKLLQIHFEPGQRLIFRRRIEQSVGGSPITCYLAGWQQTIHGQNVQSIAYVFEEGSRVELAGRFQEGHPWFYPVELVSCEIDDQEDTA